MPAEASIGPDSCPSGLRHEYAGIHYLLLTSTRFILQWVGQRVERGQFADEDLRDNRSDDDASRSP